jgi:ATP-binding cassette subfamily F protein 3
METVKAENSTVVPEIEKILKSKISAADLPPFYYEHLAGMILEEPPNDGNELFDLIGEYILNGYKVKKEQALKLCEDISTDLKKKNLITAENKLSIVAEKLLVPVTLNEIKLREEKDSNNAYADAFLGHEKLQSESSKLEEKSNKADKNAKKAMEAFEKHQADMESIKKKLPPTVVSHSKDRLTKSRDLILECISMIIGGKTLLESTPVRFVYGRKYGLVGRNGIGKTCLFNAIARQEFDKFPTHFQILLVEQEIVGDDKTVLKTVMETDVERELLLKQEQELLSGDSENHRKLDEIHERLKEIDADTAESRASTILAGLGFTNEAQKQPTKIFSGGWRMRVSLARALFAQPDILLLDEPTNHLDLDAVMWLEDYLINWPNTVVIVSHAREFLNVVCNDIVHFADQKLTPYKGNYDAFEKKRSEMITANKREAESQKMRIEHVQKFIDKFRYNAKRASMVQSRIKSINRMELVEEILEDPSCVFIFPNPDKLRPPLLKIEDGAFGYDPTKPLLKNINFGVDMESRIAIVGANGVGKTTLLKLLLGELALTAGNQTRHNRLRTSLFTQHHVEQLDLTCSPLEFFVKTFPGSNVEGIRSHLGSFGISANLALRPIYLLSGGQKSRVAFAFTVWKNPHIMIMDEPTNHLDIDAVNALIIALNNFQGGVLIVSHDQHLISLVCDQIWYIKDQRLKKFDGDFDDYRKCLATGRL